MGDERKTLGRYEILATLGRGAMGVVYKARDPLIDRVVAIKQVSLPAVFSDVQREEFVRRFFGEAKAAGRLHHPNVVTVHDLGMEDGAPFMAMELVEGESLGQILKKRAPLPAHEALAIARQVALGLAYAHEQGVIHRDIKPDNILLDTKGRPVITDFGVAHLESSDLTRTGEVLGTPHFMSPEQVKGEPLDGRSDLFSLGVVLYEMLTGQRPFRGDTISSICYQIVHAPPSPDPSQLDLPPQVRTILSGLLQKERGARFFDGHAAAEAMGVALAGLGAEDTRALSSTPVAVTVNPVEPALSRAGWSGPSAAGPSLGTGLKTMTTPIRTRRRRSALAVAGWILCGLAVLIIAGFFIRTLYGQKASPETPSPPGVQVLSETRPGPVQKPEAPSGDAASAGTPISKPPESPPKEAPAEGKAERVESSKGASPSAAEKPPPPPSTPSAAPLVPITVELSGPMVSGGYAILVDGQMKRQNTIRGRTNPADPSRKGFRATESLEEPAGPHTLRFAIRPAFGAAVFVKDWPVVLVEGSPVHLWVVAHPQKSALSVRQGDGGAGSGG